MNEVQPIKDLKKLRKMEQILKSQSTRDYILFKLGINCGLRISDILSFKVKDVRNQTHFILKEQKTGKSQKIKINPTLKKELNDYIKDMDDEDWLIPSQKYRKKITITIKEKDDNGKTRSVKKIINNSSNNSPLERMQAWRILNEAAKQAGIKEPIGCHSLRKTFGYWMYIHTNKDITIVQKFLNHSSPQITLRYIGITQEDLDDIITSFSL